MNKTIGKVKKFEDLKSMFEQVQTMRLIGGYTVQEMAEALEKQEDEIYFINNYLSMHLDIGLIDNVRGAYKILYDEEAPKVLLEVPIDKGIEVPEEYQISMETVCTREILKIFIRCRLEMVIDRLANGDEHLVDFRGMYDNEYVQVLRNTVLKFSPTKEIQRGLWKDKKIMDEMVDCVYKILYQKKKRKRMWSCDVFDFDGIKDYYTEKEEEE